MSRKRTGTRLPLPRGYWDLGVGQHLRAFAYIDLNGMSLGVQVHWRPIFVLVSLGPLQLGIDIA